MCVYYIVSYQIASYQGKKLLEEDKENINITINLHGDDCVITPEDVEVTRN